MDCVSLQFIEFIRNIGYISFIRLNVYPMKAGTMQKLIRNNNDLGSAIRLARKRQGLRQVDLAQKASVRQPLVSELETGATTARLDTVIKILAALDLDLSIIARRTGGFDPTDY